MNVLAGARYQYINNRTGATDPTNFCGPYAGPNYSGYGVPCTFDTITQRGQSIDQRVTPRVGVLWRAQEWVSFYGNYVESYSPNYDGFLALGTNQPDPPSAGQQEEGGVKFALLDNKLQISGDYYHLVKTNIPIGIPNDYVHNEVIGEGRAQGPEFDLQGELMPGWTINLGYANTNCGGHQGQSCSLHRKPGARLASSLCATQPGEYFVELRVQGRGAQRAEGGGTEYDYAGYLPFFNYYNDGTYIYGQNTPSYGIVGILASYEFPYNGYKFHAQINVDNLFDRTYFTSGGLVPNPIYQEFGGATPGWSSNYYQNTVFGAPRTIRASIKVSF